jgi:hypothetical protein
MIFVLLRNLNNLINLLIQLCLFASYFYLLLIYLLII